MSRNRLFILITLDSSEYFFLQKIAKTFGPNSASKTIKG